MSFRRVVTTIICLVLGLVFSKHSDAATLTLQWDPATDGVTVGYILLYGTTPGSYSQQTDVGYTQSYTVSGLSDSTTYYFVIRAYDATGAMSNPSSEAFATTAATVSSVSSLALSANVASPAPVGATVNWLATATGGVTPYNFQWSLFHAGAWTVGSWGASPTWSWTPTIAASDYQVKVAVRSAGSTNTTGELFQSLPFTIVAPTVASVSLTSNVPSPQVVGTTIVWSVAAAGGTAPYQYKWWLYDGTTWTAASNWTTSTTWSWTPAVANNNYSVRVWARSSGNTADAAEASTSMAYAIKPATKNRQCQGPKCK